jgi:hypothetical protein
MELNSIAKLRNFSCGASCWRKIKFSCTRPCEGWRAEARASRTTAGACTSRTPPGTQQAWSGLITGTVTPPQGATWYRVFGGGSAQQGLWLTPTMPTSSSSAINSLSLHPGNTSEYYSTVHVPGGTRYQYGTAAPAWGRPGGEQQIQVFDRLPSTSWGTRVPLAKEPIKW